MLEDILAEGDSTALSPSWCPWLDDIACVKVRQSLNGIPFLMENKCQLLGGEDGIKQMVEADNVQYTYVFISAPCSADLSSK